MPGATGGAAARRTEYPTGKRRRKTQGGRAFLVLGEHLDAPARPQPLAAEKGARSYDELAAERDALLVEFTRARRTLLSSPP